MPRPDKEQDSDYSIRLSLDIRGREKPVVWPWVVVILTALLVSSPFLGRFLDKFL